MPETIVTLLDCATGKIHNMEVIDPLAVPSPVNKQVFLMFEERYGFGGNLLRGYWREPNTHRLYKEVQPRVTQ